MAICPNCGANVGLAKICPHCGTNLAKEDKKGNQEIDRLIEVTENFSKKPSCSDSEFKELVIRFLVNASLAEKGIYEARIKAYSDNYLNGGTGIINNPLKSEYVTSGSDELSSAASVTTSASSYSTSTSSRRRRGGGNKKTTIIVASAIAGVLVIGCAVGIPLAIKASNSKAKVSEVTLNYNYPNSSSSSYYGGNYYIVNIKYGSRKNLDKTYIPYYPNYTFDGYYTSSYGGTQYFDSVGNAMCEWDYYGGSVSLYAHWTSNLPSVRIYFSDASYYGGSYSVTARQGESMPSITAPSRYGYVFNGYWTSSSGGIQYYDADGYSTRKCDLSNGTYLYAHWEEPSRTIYLDRNGGSGGSSSVYATFGESMPSISVPTKSGYIFDGYYTSTSGGTQYYNSSGYSTHTCDLSNGTYLYAHWSYGSSTGYSITYPGSYGWTLYSGTTYRSNNYHVSSSTATMLITFTSSGTFNYSYYVSSESGCDKLRIYYDNNSSPEYDISGEYSFTSRSRSVYSGSKIKIEYSKDGSVDNGDDRGYFRIDSFYH